MTQYSYSYGEYVELYDIIDRLHSILYSMRYDGAFDSPEYAALLDAAFTIGNSVSYGEEAYTDLSFDIRKEN